MAGLSPEEDEKVRAGSSVVALAKKNFLDMTWGLAEFARKVARAIMVLNR